MKATSEAAIEAVLLADGYARVDGGGSDLESGVCRGEARNLFGAMDVEASHYPEARHG